MKKSSKTGTKSSTKKPDSHSKFGSLVQKVPASQLAGLGLLLNSLRAYGAGPCY